jgi:hypothetical protein
MSTAVSEFPLAKPETGKSLFGPAWDFLLLGGGSLVALLLVRVLVTDESKDLAILATFAFANVINNPHFANSYQIFYRDFRNKLTNYPAGLRWRYFVSGVVVPILLVGFFATSVLAESQRVLGIGVNLMFFFVGWHYVKQGYGMAMVDAVLKKRFYSDSEKKTLLVNAYATWIFSWCLANYLVSGSDSKYFGIGYIAVPVPLPVVVGAGIISAVATLRVITSLWNRFSDGKSAAWNGLIAYGVSLYAWLLLRDPIVLIWVPLFHSLQYLAVVWRFELNRSKTFNSGIRPNIRFMFFIAVGLGLGYLGFWVVPGWLDSNVNYSKEIFGGSLFLFIFWIFINVHHYFLDSVMWRKGNPDVQKHLFSH